MSFYQNLIKKNTSPLIMGILNITPDSFYDGGCYNNIESSMVQIQKMIRDGVDIVDIGATSSRPGAHSISLSEEKLRLIPILKEIKKSFPNIPISIDTYNYQIAKEAIKYGIDVINDIYVEKNKTKMFELIKKHDMPYILMHMSGDPKTMQKKINYTNFHDEIIDFFDKNINTLNKMGGNNIILDPGFGFGKTVNQNYELINMIPELKKFGYPILTGLSRKSMISKPLKTTPKNSLIGTITANTVCLMKGANIIRVHDVLEAKESLKIFNLTQESNKEI